MVRKSVTHEVHVSNLILTSSVTCVSSTRAEVVDYDDNDFL